MNRRCARIVVAFALVAGVGCGFDALGTGGASPSNGDGGNGDATSGDAASESSVVLLPPVDGGTDAPIGQPGFCASQSAYFACWDFDDVMPGGDAGFAGATNATGVIDVALEGTNHVLRATLPVASAPRNSWLSQAITGFGQLANSYELDLKIGVRQSSMSYAVLGALWTTTPSNAHPVGAASYSLGTAIDMVAPDTTIARLAAPSGNAWHQAKVTLSGPANAMHGVVVVDGVTIGDELFIAGGQGATSIDVRLGAYYTGAENGGITAVFDDIVIRKQ